MKHATPLKPISKRLVSRSLTGFIAFGTALLADSVFAAEQSSIPAVGEVTFLLGKAHIERSDGVRELIKVGTLVKESDHIATGTNGHVHVRFIDQALVSVRPSSELEIQRYDYNAEAPQDSVVKFKLVEGTTRSISGKAAE